MVDRLETLSKLSSKSYKENEILRNLKVHDIPKIDAAQSTIVHIIYMQKLPNALSDSKNKLLNFTISLSVYFSTEYDSGTRNNIQYTFFITLIL